MTCDAQTTVQAVRSAAEVIQEHREELTDLDRAIGDSDHGENMSRGFSAVIDVLDATDPATPAAALKVVATTLISKVGGASGPLFGTAFLRAATSLGDAEQLDAAAVADAIAAAADGVAARGKSAPGDKTVVDALAPAAQAATSAAITGTIADVLEAAAAAAEQGAAETEPLVARKGRASYLGERSAGHVDPGARSAAYLLRSFAESASSG